MNREARPTVPPYVEYSLTPMWRGAGERVEPLADWIEYRLPDIPKVRRTRTEKAGRQSGGVHRLR